MTTGETPDRMSIVFANVRTSNREHQLFLSTITSKESDLIIVEEVNKRWVDVLRKLDTTHPYQKLIPNSDNFGIAIYSRHPLQDVEIVDFANEGIPSISASIALNNRKFRIIAVHPGPPVTNFAANRQRKFFENLAQEVTSKAGPVVVVGDLNSSMWSPRYQKLIRDTALINARQGKGIFPTWSPDWRIAPALSIPIDHILVSAEFDVENFETLPATGSDHLPIFAEINF